MPKTPKHHGFDWPLTLSISRWGRAVINQNQAARELNTLPGPFCSALGPKPPTPENAQFLHPSSSRKKQTNKQKPRTFEGAWWGRVQGRGPEPPFLHHRGSGSPPVPRLHTLQSSAPDTRTQVALGRGCQKFTGSREGRKWGGVSRRPSLPRAARASTRKNGLREVLSERAAGSRTPWKSAVSWLRRRLLPPPDSFPLEAGPDAAPAPGGWAEAQRKIWPRQPGARHEGPP